MKYSEKQLISLGLKIPDGRIKLQGKGIGYTPEERKITEIPIIPNIDRHATFVTETFMIVESKMNFE